MTQTSAFYNGFQLGDAQKYSAEFTHAVLSHLYIGESGYVVGSALTDLQTTFNAGQTVDVAAGAAFIEGVYYSSDATVSFVLDDNDTTYYRLDRIVVRVDWTAQTARLVAKRGTASVYTQLPELQQEFGNIYEISLAIIVCPPSFTSFDDTYIIDDRDFLAQPLYDDRVKNIMPNSEFMADKGDIQYAVPIPMWKGNHSSSPVTYLGKNQLVNRGKTAYVTYTGALSTYLELNQNDSSQPVTISFPIRVTSGIVDFSLDGGATTLYRIPVTYSDLVIKARDTVSAASHNIQPHFSGGQFQLGQVTLSFGMVAAPFCQQSETIILPSRTIMGIQQYGLSSGDYNVTIIPPPAGTKNMIVSQYFEDDNSSTSDSVYVAIRDKVNSTTGIDLFRLEIGRVVDTVGHFQQCIVPTEARESPSGTLPIHIEIPVASSLTQYYVDLVGVEV